MSLRAVRMCIIGRSSDNVFGEVDETALNQLTVAGAYTPSVACSSVADVQLKR